MKITLMLVSYNGGQTHSVLSSVGDFLLRGAPDSFGPAITVCDVYLWMRSSSAPIPGLEWMAERFRRSAEALPTLRFMRKMARMDIALMCGFGDLETIEAVHPGSDESVRVFRDACQQVRDRLMDMRKRLKKGDVFDWRAFDAQIAKKMEMIPKDPSELAQFIERHGSH